MNIKRGDTVEVIAGNHLGQRGEVQRIVRGRVKYGHSKGAHDPNMDRIMVAGVNIVKKHQKRTGRVNTQTGIIEREAPLHHSNLLVVCPKCDKPTRVGLSREGESVQRVCKKCQALFD